MRLVYVIHLELIALKNKHPNTNLLSDIKK